MSVHRAFLLLGSNLDKERNIVAAVARLATDTRLLGVSRVYESVPVARPDQPTFLNAAALVVTPRSPTELRDGVLRQIESALGRRRGPDRHAPRTIDLDLVLYDRVHGTLGDLRLPDPEIVRFAHVAVPLAELAPGYLHPESGVELGTLADRLSEGLDPPLRPRSDVDLAPYLWDDEATQGKAGGIGAS